MKAILFFIIIIIIDIWMYKKDFSIYLKEY